MKTIHYIYIAALLVFASCQERMNVSTEDSAPGLVIYGYITTDTTAHSIRITRSSGYFAETAPQGISGAGVSISTPSRTYPLSESASDPGLYQTSPDVYGEIGESYTLRISVDFGGKGQREDFEATTLLPPPPTIDSISFAPFTAHDRILQVMAWGRMPETTGVNYFNSRLFINGKLYNDSLGGFRISNDQYLATGREIRGLPIFFLNQDRDRSKLTPGDTVTVELEGITAEYATFIDNAQDENRGSNPMFSGPPANVPGNIRSVANNSATLVLGFFGARSKTATSVVYD